MNVSYVVISLCFKISCEYRLVNIRWVIYKKTWLLYLKHKTYSINKKTPMVTITSFFDRSFEWVTNSLRVEKFVNFQENFYRMPFSQ